MIRTASQIALGLMMWPLVAVAMLPRLLARGYRALRRMVKPVALLLNAWRYKDTEEEVAHLVALRESAVKREQWLRRKQVRLSETRAQINQW